MSSAVALGQVAGDVTERLRACSVLVQAERVQCLEKLAHDIGPLEPQSATESSTGTLPAANKWIVSETMSPVDYSPVATATASYGDGRGGPSIELSIQCRGGRTDLVIGGSTITRRAEDYVVSCVVGGGQQVVLAVGASASGTGFAVKGDVVRLLASLPDRGEVTFRVMARQGAVLEGRYDLIGLKVVRERLAVHCRWPAGTHLPTKR